eukprot:4988262-Prorocentrum_lima.AAC.1
MGYLRDCAGTRGLQVEEAERCRAQSCPAKWIARATQSGRASWRQIGRSWRILSRKGCRRRQA